jgi:carboxypeptidase C (cathepsin A)
MQDLPVGVGYSYAEDPSLLARTDSEVVADASALLKALAVAIPTLQSSPLFLVGESYGGKLAAMIGVDIARSIHAGSLKLTLGGVVLGDSWISPADFAVSSFLTCLNISMIKADHFFPTKKSLSFSTIPLGPCSSHMQNCCIKCRGWMPMTSHLPTSTDLQTLICLDFQWCPCEL